MICHHFNLSPTDWNQPRPEPCEVVKHCACGQNYSCPICGWGQGAYPCRCQISDKVNTIIKDHAVLWKALADL